MTSTRRIIQFGAALSAAFIAACSSAPPPPPPAPEPEPVPVVDVVLDLAAAADRIALDFTAQFGSVEGTRTLAIDPLLDSVTAQQTGVTRRVEAALARAFATYIPGATLNPFNLDGIGYSRYFVAGIVAPGDTAGAYRIIATATDRQTGAIVASSSARLVEPGLDATPTRFFAESPAIIRDADIEGYFRTATARVGERADSHYVAQYPTSALLAQALEAYDAGEWRQALTHFTTAANRPNGQNARTLAGLYLANVKINRPREAEIIFGRLATLGLKSRSFAVKMLFRPGSATEFWPGPEHGAVYPMWIRQIAQSARTANVCINIVGHTSRSGSAEVNERISLQRAQTVKRLLEGQVRALASRLTATGVGYRENIVGTGTDDAIDAIDRRVEFKVVDCR